jgi:hypothetical protein
LDFEAFGGFCGGSLRHHPGLVTANAPGENSPFEKLMPSFTEGLRDHGCANVKIEVIKNSGHYVADATGGRGQTRRTVRLVMTEDGLSAVPKHAKNLKSIPDKRNLRPINGVRRS